MKHIQEEADWTSKHPDSDENFYLIAGYTSGGTLYGITWKQAEMEGLPNYLNELGDYSRL